MKERNSEFQKCIFVFIMYSNLQNLCFPQPINYSLFHFRSKRKSKDHQMSAKEETNEFNTTKYKPVFWAHAHWWVFVRLNYSYSYDSNYKPQAAVRNSVLCSFLGLHLHGEVTLMWHLVVRQVLASFGFVQCGIRTQLQTTRHLLVWLHLCLIWYAVEYELYHYLMFDLPP